MNSSISQVLLVLLSLSAPLFSQAPMDSSRELTDLRIASVASQVERIRQLVEMGAEARIKLEEAERTLADTQDEAILRRSLYTDPSSLNDQAEENMLAAAQRRLDRQREWIERIEKLAGNGFADQSDLLPLEAELRSRQLDLDLAQSAARLRIEAAELAQKASALHSEEPTPETEQEVATEAMEHYEGTGFNETRDLKPLEMAFQVKFDHPLPISADGETDLHRALGFDHRGRIDVAISPATPEGIWLRQYLRLRRISYYAFTRAIKGKATAAHIHIGTGSTRLLSLHAKSNGTPPRS